MINSVTRVLIVLLFSRYRRITAIVNSALSLGFRVVVIGFKSPGEAGISIHITLLRGSGGNIFPLSIICLIHCSAK